MCSVCEKKGIPSLSSPGRAGVCRSRGPAPAGADKTHLSLENPTAQSHLLYLTQGGADTCRANPCPCMEADFPPSSLHFHGHQIKSGHSRVLAMPNSKTSESTQLSALPAPPPSPGQMGTNEGILLGNNRFPQGRLGGSQTHHPPILRQQDEMPSLSSPKTD